MAKEKGHKPVAQNRKARHDYNIHDTYEAGIVLAGTEVKSLREGRASLADAFATVDEGEVWLRNAHIPEYSHGTWTNHTARRTRKLLLHRREIRRLIGAVERQGLTLVPLDLYFTRGVAKVTLALGKGKKLHDKREDARKRDDEREMARALVPRDHLPIVGALGSCHRGIDCVGARVRAP